MPPSSLEDRRRSHTLLALACMAIACATPSPRSRADGREPTPAVGEAASSEQATDTFVDSRDATRYPTVKIGNLVWMGTNLAFQVPGVTRCYDDAPSNCATYGALYTFASALSACPDGWRLATDADWQDLERALGMPVQDLDLIGYTTVRGTNQGDQIRSGGSAGFHARMAGFFNQGYFALDDRTYYWVDRVTPEGDVFRRRVNHDLPTIYRFTNPSDGFMISVRCVKGT